MLSSLPVAGSGAEPLSLHIKYPSHDAPEVSAPRKEALHSSQGHIDLGATSGQPDEVFAKLAMPPPAAVGRYDFTFRNATDY